MARSSIRNFLLIIIAVFLCYESYIYATLVKSSQLIEERINNRNFNNSIDVKYDSIEKQMFFKHGLIINNLKVNLNNGGELVFLKLKLSWNMFLNKLFLEVKDVIEVQSAINNKKDKILCKLDNSKTTAIFSKSLINENTNITDIVHMTDLMRCIDDKSNVISNMRDIMLTVNIDDINRKYRWKSFSANADDINGDIISNEFSGFLGLKDNSANFDIYKMEVRGRDFNISVNGNLNLSYSDIMLFGMRFLTGIDNLPLSSTSGEYHIIIDGYNNFLSYVEEEKISFTNQKSHNESSVLLENIITAFKENAKIIENDKFVLVIKASGGKFYIGEKLFIGADGDPKDGFKRALEGFLGRIQ